MFSLDECQSLNICISQFVIARSQRVMRIFVSDMCPEGYVSKRGLQPCFPCPMGYFQPHKGKSACYLCPNNVRTAHVGATRITDCEGISGAHEGHSGDIIPTSQLVINECFKEPCDNNATCNPIYSGYTCICQPGWQGIHCESEIDECSSNPCHNNATCHDLLNSFTCNCKLGYTGEQTDHLVM